MEALKGISTKKKTPLPKEGYPELPKRKGRDVEDRTIRRWRRRDCTDDGVRTLRRDTGWATGSK